MHKETQRLVRDLRRQGVEVEPTNGGHYKALTGDGPVFFPQTPGDRRSVQNTISQLRKRGVHV